VENQLPSSELEVYEEKPVPVETVTPFETKVEYAVTPSIAGRPLMIMAGGGVTLGMMIAIVEVPLPSIPPIIDPTSIEPWVGVSPLNATGTVLVPSLFSALTPTATLRKMARSTPIAATASVAFAADLKKQLVPVVSKNTAPWHTGWPNCALALEQAATHSWKVSKERSIGTDSDSMVVSQNTS
jgi:hypothetical protein